MLAWALCLPLAQWATAVHTLQHLRPVALEEREQPANLPAACDICLVAAAIGGGAPLPAAQAHVPVLLPQPAPRFLPAGRHDAPAPRFYASRAPPLLPA
jgi:hypothetical protein